MDIFEEIIECLEREAGKKGKVAVDNQVLKEFFGTVAPVPSATSSLETPGASRHGANSGDIASGSVSDPAKAADLKTLEQQARQCRNCRLHERRRNVVFGEGNPDADLMFVGEGPDTDEDIQGRPFVGKAGQLLTRMINAMQFTREQVYIANIVKCHPPNNRNPEPDEAACCLPYLERQIALVSPRIIVTLGAVPLNYLLGKTGVTRERGRWQEYNHIRVMPTFHPAFLLRKPEAKREVWQDLQQVMQVFGKKHGDGSATNSTIRK